MGNIHWFRRDLRIDDNKALFKALETDSSLACVFIFDPHILDKLDSKEDRRVSYIFERLEEIKKEIKSKLYVFLGKPEEVYSQLLENNKIETVFANADFEPYARKRDKKIQKLLDDSSVNFERCIDHIIFSPDKIKTQQKTDYSVYTPYSKQWRANLKDSDLKNYPSEKKICEAKSFKLNTDNLKLVKSLEDIGFKKTKTNIEESFPSKELINAYKENRDFPYLDKATSHLGTALRFGSISTRKLVKYALKAQEKTYLSELIWREFFIQHMFHHPRVAKENYRDKFNKLKWRTNKNELEAWKEGRTGIPIVDAGMRELNETGYMHNRVRMICANFFTKHLFMDWRVGEAYFAQKLNDFELASNVGNWQWAAGTGCDAAPYFRIFNPELQEKKFDPDRKYIKKWIPEIDTKDYPEPILDIKAARDRALEAFEVLKKD